MRYYLQVYMSQEKFALFCFQMEEGTVWFYAVEKDPEESKQSLLKMQKEERITE